MRKLKTAKWLDFVYCEKLLLPIIPSLKKKKKRFLDSIQVAFIFLSFTVCFISYSQLAVLGFVCFLLLLLLIIILL